MSIFDSLYATNCLARCKSYENASEDGNVRGLLLNLVFNKMIRSESVKLSDVTHSRMRQDNAALECTG